MININKVKASAGDLAMLSKYRRAEAFEHETFTESMVLNSNIYPHWVKGSNSFWYVKKTHSKNSKLSKIIKSFCLVNAENGSNIEAFDHGLLANLLSNRVEGKVDCNNLPISQIDLELSPRRVSFTAFQRSWIFDQSEESCEEISPRPSFWIISPDGKKAAFLRDFNLWVRDLESGEEFSLTQDGVRHHAYGVQPERVNLVAGLDDMSWVNSEAPEVLWSPDSKRLLTYQVDERQVLSLPVTRYVPTDGTVRPQSIQTKYALPGDKHIAEFKVLAIDVSTAHACYAHHPAIFDSVLWAGLFSGNRAWWAKNSCQAFFIDMSRGQKQASVISFNTDTGEAFTLFSEVSETHIDLNLEFERPASLMPLPETSELIWFSERTGWAHLYLYCLDTGVLKRAITEGKWLVREVLHYNVNSRDLLILSAGRSDGRDPYYREIIRVNIDTGGMLVLASSNHDYTVWVPSNIYVGLAKALGSASDNCCGVSESGSYIVTTRSRVDCVPVTEVLDIDGNTLFSVETADISMLPQGWVWPEPVQLMSADKKRDIYGVIFRPTDFSSEKSYPVVDWAHTNSFYAFVPKGAFEKTYVYMAAQAYAELGFIVVVLDGRGSCNRDKSFHDLAYGSTHLGSNLEDHVSGIKQLAEKYPYMDISRVGIVDTFGSNSPVYGLLAYPDFYKVGAVGFFWDVRLLTQGETYQGLPPKSDYQKSVLANMAGNLKGKLLLIQSMNDPYFLISGAFQLIESLQKENKNLDLIMLPSGGHALYGSNHYSLRRIWDYLVTHLLISQPPEEFCLSNGIEFALESFEEWE